MQSCSQHINAHVGQSTRQHLHLNHELGYEPTEIDDSFMKSLFSYYWVLLVIAVIGFSFSAHAQDDRSPGNLTCTMSAFFSGDAENSMAVGTTHLEGRGLLSCKSEKGLGSEMPVRADLETILPAGAKQLEFALSGNSTTFVVPREMTQVQDSYKILALPTQNGKSASYLFRGIRNDLAIEMKLNSPSSSLDGIKVTALTLTFDEQAPDLN